MSIDPPGYPPPPSQGMGMGELQPTVEPMGIASMVTGILSILTCCCPYLGGFLGLVASGLGIGSIVRVNGSPQTLKGKGFAIAGISTGAVGVLLALVGILFSASVATGKFKDYLPKDMREQFEKMERQQRERKERGMSPSAPSAPSDDDELAPGEGNENQDEPAAPSEPSTPPTRERAPTKKM